MSGPGGTDLLLFVAGSPGAAEEAETHSTLVRWVLGANAEVRFREWRRQRRKGSSMPAQAGGPASPEELPWHLPREMVMSIELVCKSAARSGKHVTLIDVNRAGIHQELVRLWVGANDVFPLLIRPDGNRLEGIESFTPRTLRGFLRGP